MKKAVYSGVHADCIMPKAVWLIDNLALYIAARTENDRELQLLLDAIVSLYISNLDVRHLVPLSSGRQQKNQEMNH